MWGQQSDELYERRTVTQAPYSDLHNIVPHESLADGSADKTSQLSTPSSDDSNQIGGTWGEHDVGGPVRRGTAMTDFDQLRLELTRLSSTRSRSVASTARRKSSLKKAQTSSTAQKTKTRGSEARKSVDSEAGIDAEDAVDQEDDDFELDDFLRDGHFEKRTHDGESAKKIGVLFQHLTVKGVGASMIFTKTLPEAIIGTFGPDLYRLGCRFVPALRVGRQPPTKDLIRDFTGFVRDGEMMLVLGRPGAGCSTFLKAIANERDSFAAVEGEVSYGGISAQGQRKSYKGEVSYNPEDDVHLPALTVWQTLRFALMNKTRKHEAGNIPTVVNALLKMFGISHTRDTAVGNEYVRGVSGGERKRVGIAETLATKSSVVCWDNSTRGLDASTALDYAKSLRILTDVSNRTTLVTLYQAGEGIYEQMDKVLVIEAGRMIYQGPADAAKQYFLDLGFHCPDRQTTADFLTSIGDPNERQFRAGMEASAPKTAQELEETFRNSNIYKQILQETGSYRRSLKTEHPDTVQFREAVQQQKSNSPLISDDSSYTVSFWRQVLACTLREFWMFWGDKTMLYTKGFIIISTGLIVSSLFYGQSLDTSGAFSRGGTLFFAILFLGWLQLTELMSAVSGRVVIARHRSYAFYRPSAVVIARVLLDLPILAVQSVLFAIILYFLSELSVDAGKFFILLLIVYTTTICITALYRLFAALSPTIDDAVRFAGLALNLLIFYVGYVIPQQTLIGRVPWFGWLYYVNPISYAYEAVMANEFSDRVMQCSPSQLVPRGAGIDPQYQTCSLAGASPNDSNVSGSAYLYTSFEYTRSHLWRNFGIILAFTIFYIFATAVASELFSFTAGGGGALIFKKSKKAKAMVKQEQQTLDIEKAVDKGETGASLSSDTLQNESSNVADLAHAKSIFTWENITYEVPIQGGTKKLLNNVSGYVKPGSMIALMGASGAGKTTLLNTLSQRQKVGTVSGEMLVDGRPLGIEFQRGTGFCEQMDLHDQTATIREALEFSAILRQDRDVPKQEKLDYVTRIIELLELHDIEDALIMSLGVEQRKRLTIGVELAAKPDLLLFLDEPTSGLDSQSAFSIIRFLRKLSQAGQAIICTIHQPSSMLVQQFDMILALNPGGNPFYFGPVGENGSAVVKYFADRGTECPPSKNIAEFILETAAKGGTRGPDGRRKNWNKEWLQSEQNAAMLDEIRRIKEERSKSGRTGKDKSNRPDREFAAPVTLQTYMVTKRTFVSYWRDPSYLYGKLFTAVLIGIFNGFTFYNLDDSLSSLQLRLFTLFVIFVIPPTVVNGVVPKFYQNRSLWEIREHPSKIYNWFAFCTAQVVAEIPMAIICSAVYWLLWYFPTDLPRETSIAGYSFLMTMLFFLFMASWGQWICAFAPSFTVISNLLPFFFTVFALFNGIIRPYDQIPSFWRYWIYYVNPATWWIKGLMAAVLGNFQVQCTQGEATTFLIPAGQTCQSYAGNFVQNVGAGYLLDPAATGSCGYCPYANGAEYLSTINVSPDERWRDFGVFLAFVVSNWMLVYFFIWTVRVKGWSFGLGWVFGSLRWVVEVLKKGGARCLGRKEKKSSGPGQA